MQFLFQVAGAVFVAVAKIIMFVASDNCYSTKGHVHLLFVAVLLLVVAEERAEKVGVWFWCEQGVEIFWDELGQWGWCVGGVEPKRALELHFCFVDWVQSRAYPTKANAHVLVSV